MSWRTASASRLNFYRPLLPVVYAHTTIAFTGPVRGYEHGGYTAVTARSCQRCYRHLPVFICSTDNVRGTVAFPGQAAGLSSCWSRTMQIAWFGMRRCLMAFSSRRQEVTICASAPLPGRPFTGRSAGMSDGCV